MLGWGWISRTDETSYQTACYKHTITWPSGLPYSTTATSMLIQSVDCSLLIKKSKVFSLLKVIITNHSYHSCLVWNALDGSLICLFLTKGNPNTCTYPALDCIFHLTWLRTNTSSIKIIVGLLANKEIYYKKGILALPLNNYIFKKIFFIHQWPLFSNDLAGNGIARGKTCSKWPRATVLLNSTILKT